MRRQASTCIFIVATLAGARAGRVRAFADPDKPDDTDREVIVIDGGRGHAERRADVFGAAGQYRDRAALLASGPFLTILHADDHHGESVGDALARTVGARVQRLGGYGAFATLSVRGLAPGTTEVVIDGVPLSRLSSVTADVGQWEMAQFERVELYRGGGGGAGSDGGGADGGLGGALHLVSPSGRSEDGDRGAVALGLGSWGVRHARAWHGDDAAWGRWRVTAGLARSRGDFSYFDDRGTQLNADDDRWQVRANNDVIALDASVRVASPADTTDSARSTAWSGGVSAAHRDQGLAGGISVPAHETRLTTTFATADAKARHAWSPRWGGDAGLYATGEHQRYRDPKGEVGVGVQDRTYDTAAVGGRAGANYADAWYRLRIAFDGRGERYEDRDATGQHPGADGARLGLGAWASASVAVNNELAFDVGVKAERLHTAAFTDLDTSERAAARTDWHAMPRVAVRYAAAPSVMIKASAGSYRRTPTLIEMFGDRGFVWGNPDLRPESGHSADVGVVWAPGVSAARVAIDRVLVEAAAFVASSRDTIVWSSTSGYVMRPINLGDARVGGLEVNWHARWWRRIALAGNYTYLASSQRNTEPSYEGNPLPQRPAHQLYLRVDVAARRGRHPVVVSGELDHASGSYLDAAATREVPARALVGASVSIRLAASRRHVVDLALQGQNLADRRVERLSLASPPSPAFATVPRPIMDVAGYPLPGRSWLLGAVWHY